MYLGGMGLGQIAQGLPADLLNRAIAEERDALAKAPDKAAHLRQRIATLSDLRDRLARQAEAFRARLPGITDAALHAAIEGQLELMERAVTLTTTVIAGLRRGMSGGVSGLGAGPGWAAGTLTAFSQFGAGQILAMTAGLAVAMILLVTAVTGHEKLVEMFPNISQAAKTAVTIVAVAAGLIGTIWVARVVRDIWERPRRGPDEAAARAAAEAAAARRVVALSPR